MPTKCREISRQQIPPRRMPRAPRHFFLLAVVVSGSLGATPTSLADEPSLVRLLADTANSASPQNPADCNAVWFEVPAESQLENRLPPTDPFIQPVIRPEPVPAKTAPLPLPREPFGKRPFPMAIQPVPVPTPAETSIPLPLPSKLVTGEFVSPASNIVFAQTEELPVQLPSRSPQPTLLEEVPASEKRMPASSVNQFGLRPLTSISTNIGIPSSIKDLPVNTAEERFLQEPLIAHAGNVGRDWGITDYRWEASMLCHGPILFEQLNAERYGITYGCLQPAVSAAHFFVTVPALPYKVWAQGHDHCQYALGYYRPGSYAEPQYYRPRISADAGLFQAGVIVGLIYILP
jgi:hypothetical protein